MDTPPPTPENSIYLGKVLTSMGESTSAGLSKFSGWMLIGYAAILATLLANLNSATKFLTTHTLSHLAWIFSVVVILNVIQRYSAATVASSVEASNKVQNTPPPQSIDLAEFLVQVESATLWPARVLVRRSNRKILAGDFAAGGRLISKLAQFEAWLAFGQVIASVIAAWVLASGLHG